MPDPIFAHPRLAQLYDPLEDSRSDLDLYIALLTDLGATRVVDIGCGTGTLACALAGRGLDVIGVDPADASLAVARRKPHADRVLWRHGDAASLPALAADAVTMTGNVAQVFIGDDGWSAALAGVHRALLPGGWLLFEARDPAAEAWHDWNREASYREVDVDGVGVVRSWVDVTRVELPLVSFRWMFEFDDGTVLTSDSTLRFRTASELEQSLAAAGFTVSEVRDAPDRPGKELVFVAQRRGPRADHDASVNSAIGWGAFCASSLVLGAILALLRSWSVGLVGIVLAFGAGALISPQLSPPGCAPSVDCEDDVRQC